MAAVLVVFDGVGDEGVNTPLQSAHTPRLDSLAYVGMAGLFNAIRPGVAPGSGIAHTYMFGYNVEHYPGRGVFEALGGGVELREGDVAIRGNVATVIDNVVVDRRGGVLDTEETTQLLKDLDGMVCEGVRCIVKPAKEHRFFLVLRGEGLGVDVQLNDPHAVNVAPHPIVALGKGSEKTARVLNTFVKAVEQHFSTHPLIKELKDKGRRYPTTVLLRGIGRWKPVQSFSDRFGLSAGAIAGGNLYKGVAKFFGMEVLNVKGATGTQNTSLFAKAEALRHAVKRFDFVFLHVKATDTLAHRKDRVGKRQFLERIDKELGEALVEVVNEGHTVAITGDHTTSSLTGEHTGLPCPVLIAGGGVRQDSVKRFDEVSVGNGALGLLRGNELIHVLLDVAGWRQEWFP
jgi:2,3-bisphosphoglycerate-independent phosphoglycerate mutase